MFQEFDDYRDADDAVYELNGKELLGERWVLLILFLVYDYRCFCIELTDYAIGMGAYLFTCMYLCGCVPNAVIVIVCIILFEIYVDICITLAVLY